MVFWIGVGDQVDGWDKGQSSGSRSGSSERSVQAIRVNMKRKRGEDG